MKHFLTILACIAGLVFVQDVHAVVHYSFEGVFDFQNEKLDIEIHGADDSSIKGQFTKPSDSDIHAKFTVDHLKTSLFELSSEIDTAIEIVRTEDNYIDFISGRINSQYSLVNKKPIEALSGRFKIVDGVVQIDNVEFGRLFLNGNLNFGQPLKYDINFQLNSVEMQDFIRFWTDNDELFSEGLVSGSIRAQGRGEELNLKGNLESLNGYVGQLEFDRFNLKAEGTYPVLVVDDSVVSESQGLTYTFNGSIDIGDKENFGKQVKELVVAPVINDSEDEVEWMIRQSNEEKLGRTEFKYFLKKEDGPSASEEKRTGMIGVERKVEF